MTKVNTGNRRIIVFLMGTAHLIASMGIGIGIGFAIGYNINGTHLFRLTGGTNNRDKADSSAELHSRRKTIAKGLPTGALLRGKDITFNPTVNTVSESRPAPIPSTAPSLSPSSEQPTSKSPTSGPTVQTNQISLGSPTQPPSAKPTLSSVPVPTAIPRQSSSSTEQPTKRKVGKATKTKSPTRSPSAKSSKSPSTADAIEISQTNPTQTPSAEPSLSPTTDKVSEYTPKSLYLYHTLLARFINVITSLSPTPVALASHLLPNQLFL